MKLFGGSKIPGLNTAALNAINEQNKKKQVELAGQQEAALMPTLGQYEQKRNALSAQLQPGAEKLLGQYGQEISQVNKAEQEQANAASNLNREQQFRNVPAIQQAIRNQLGGNRLMGSGAALSSLAQPTIQAAQSASDFAANQEAERLANQTQRMEGFATTGFNTRQKALADKLGIDEGTINELTQMGRTDLIDKFNALSGAEEQYGANQLSIEQARQMNDIAQAQAKAQKRSAITGLLGTAAGAGIGLALPGSSLLAPALGAQIGGQLGGMAGGGTPQQFDPTLLFALAQQQGVKRQLGTPIGGGRTTYNPPSYSKPI